MRLDYKNKGVQSIAMLELKIKKTDDELQVAYVEVYAPGFPDSQSDYMTATEVRKMAHKFLAEGKVRKVDTQHDEVENGSVVVESFIARSDDQVFIPESWVVGIHFPDKELWDGIKNNKYNGVSLQALVKSQGKEIEVEVPEVIMGETDDHDGHTHLYEVKFAEDGTFLGGLTNVVKGHYHTIKRGTITELGGDDTHGHRYSFLDQLI